MHKRTLSTYLLLLILLVPTLASATESLNTLQTEVRTFLKSPDSELAPATSERAQALLGAAILADQQHDEAELPSRIEAAAQALANAKQLAADFHKKHADLLALRSAAIEASGISGDPQLTQANATFHEMINAVEQGRLNTSAQLAAQASDGYAAVINTALPHLMQRTSDAISGAAAEGASYYAPQIYKKAKAWFKRTQAYLDGTNKQRPLHPRLGLELAQYAHDIAVQVKQYRRDQSSHEKLMLEAKANRLRIATALGIAVNHEDPRADVSVDDLVSRIKALQAKLTSEHAAYARQLADLKAQYAQQLQQQLQAQKDTLTKEGHTQIADLKAAFQAKLQRETFEQRRQEQVRKLFKQGEVSISANLDGSLLIRLSSLHFATGASGIERKYYDLLSKLKQALNIYSDRNVQIEGHTDNRGDAKMNRELSLKRAEAVRDFLVAAGVPAKRLKALGYGDVRPIASNAYKKGRAMNRRIDVIVQAPPAQATHG